MANNNFPKKESLQKKLDRMPAVEQIELFAYIKYGGKTDKELLVKYSRYNITEWSLNDLKQIFGFVHAERNDEIVKLHFEKGLSPDQIGKLVGLKPSRVGDILRYYRPVKTSSKELFEL